MTFIIKLNKKTQKYSKKMGFSENTFNPIQDRIVSYQKKRGKGCFKFVCIIIKIFKKINSLYFIIV
jgi:hypothetical protein